MYHLVLFYETTSYRKHNIILGFKRLGSILKVIRCEVNYLILFPGSWPVKGGNEEWRNTEQSNDLHARSEASSV